MISNYTALYSSNLWCVKTKNKSLGRKYNNWHLWEREREGREKERNPSEISLGKKNHEIKRSGSMSSVLYHIGT